MTSCQRWSDIFPMSGVRGKYDKFLQAKTAELSAVKIRDNGSVITQSRYSVLKKCANLSSVKNRIEICTFNYGGKIMDNEAILRYKFYLCRTFLDKLLRENLITETQRKRIETAVIKRITEV